MSETDEPEEQAPPPEPPPFQPDPDLITELEKGRERRDERDRASNS